MITTPYSHEKEKKMKSASTRMKTQHSMLDHIPYEIQLEIIKRVSVVKSLVRFMSVSKPWKSFIESSEFIACFGVRHTQPHRLLLRSCGLWGLQGFRKSTPELFVIWNPSIRKLVGIVVPHLHKSITCFGFGVCPLTYDPTIVKMSYLEREDSRNLKWQVEIFTLSSKTWKMLPSNKLPRKSICIISLTQPVIDRFIFWLTYDIFVGKCSVLSFDLITHESKEGQGTSLWRMEDGVKGGVMTSFTKLFNINISDSFFLSMLLGFWMNGEPIIETEKDQDSFAKIQVYEPCSEHISDLGVNGGVPSSFFIFPYKETLLLIDHSDGKDAVPRFVDASNKLLDAVETSQMFSDRIVETQAISSNEGVLKRVICSNIAAPRATMSGSGSPKEFALGVMNLENVDPTMENGSAVYRFWELSMSISLERRSCILIKDANQRDTCCNRYPLAFCCN
nr:hypothetical protein [Tanacetum cinerariifolium]